MCCVQTVKKDKHGVQPLSGISQADILNLPALKMFFLNVKGKITICSKVDL